MTSKEPSRATTAPPPDDVAMGVASWDVDPIEVAAYPAVGGEGPLGTITLDGQAVTPATARRLAAVLVAAADHAECRD